jgi:hypothetical protein
MSDPQPAPDTGDKAGMPVHQPATGPSAQKPAVPQDSSGDANPDVNVKPGMSVGHQ